LPTQNKDDLIASKKSMNAQIFNLAWLYGLSIVSITAFRLDFLICLLFLLNLSAPLAMLLTPLLKKSLYDKCMTFLVSLGIGAMSGSCLFILLPHAFNIGQVNESEYLQKCILIAGAIYAFFGVDRLLQCFIEMKRVLKSD
jgi:zinc transporter ZupT